MSTQTTNPKPSAHPNTHTPPSQTPSPKPNTPDLFHDFLTGDVPLDVILADHNLTPDQFLAWVESPKTQQRLETLAKIDAARAKAIAATTRAEALNTLRRVMFASKSLSEVRRAANALLRYDASQSALAAKALVAAKAATPAPPKPQQLTVKQLIAESIKSLDDLDARLASRPTPPPSAPTPTPTPNRNPNPNPTLPSSSSSPSSSSLSPSPLPSAA